MYTNCAHGFCNIETLHLSPDILTRLKQSPASAAQHSLKAHAAPPMRREILVCLIAQPVARRRRSLCYQMQSTARTQCSATFEPRTSTSSDRFVSSATRNELRRPLNSFPRPPPCTASSVSRSLDLPRCANASSTAATAGCVHASQRGTATCSNEALLGVPPLVVIPWPAGAGGCRTSNNCVRATKLRATASLAGGATIFMVALISVAVAAAWQRGSAHEVLSRCPHQKLAGSHALKELCTSLLAANAAAGVSPTASLFVDVGAAYASESLLAHAFGYPVLALECRKEEYDTLLRTRLRRLEQHYAAPLVCLGHSWPGDAVSCWRLIQPGEVGSCRWSPRRKGAQRAAQDRARTPGDVGQHHLGGGSAASLADFARDIGDCRA
eukprot:scaffold91817_cov75-Phaeocystis_antarctica.AAC.6